MGTGGKFECCLFFIYVFLFSFLFIENSDDYMILFIS